MSITDMHSLCDKRFSVPLPLFYNRPMNKNALIGETYDVIVVLGIRPDTQTWRFPNYVYDCLKRAKEHVDNGLAPLIAVSGDHSLVNEHLGINQPFKECDKLEEYLLSLGCPPDAIVKEDRSRDTISNLYFLKKNIFIPRHIKRILLITTKAREQRISFLAQKVLGPAYELVIETVKWDSPQTEVAMEAFGLEKERYFLAEMPDGDHSWLDGAFYDHPMYEFWKQYDQSHLR
jgi:uncharacterized SAM-binding protein YcdF (DUF218 family)